MNITLIGMPGSGKSYLGKKLAAKLCYNFADTDVIIENEYGLPIKEVLDKLGEKAFLKKQGEVAISLIGREDKTIISTGGSIIYTDMAMSCLEKNSVIVYLDLPLKVIKERLENEPRKVIGLKDKNFSQLYKKRTSLYKKWASETVDANQNSEKVIEDILGIIGNIIKK